MSPRPGPRRPYVAVRLDPDTLAWLDEQAAAREISRSELIRALLNAARERG